MPQNKKPAPFLQGIDRIIFDMDGVITSEQNYWNAAALTVYEMLNSCKYFGSRSIKTDLSSLEIKEIRDTIFINDKLIVLLKDRGVNSNWDLAYVVLCISFIINKVWSSEFGVWRKNFLNLSESTTHYRDVYQYISRLDIQGYEIYTFIEQKLSEITGQDKEYFKRNGELWNKCQQVFQEWYLGDTAYLKTYGHAPQQPGKPGLMYSEQPIIPLSELREIIEVLYFAGIKLGIGTGRPFVEIDQPLISWDIKQYFHSDSYITYTEVIKAEQALDCRYKKTNLAKPHPYVFLKAIYGKEYSDMALLQGDYDKNLIDRTLIVGDAGSDIMAAKAINCKFAAVLTGAAGHKARGYFEKMGAHYILNSIRELII